ncbi:MAG: peptide chain release factor 2, partial [Actinobacteria bacterium]|nr:peptide chain release factor 2 [Actinomycetota bacterium]
PRSVIKELRSRLGDARRFLDVDGKLAAIAGLRVEASAPDLWEDQKRALEVTRRLASCEQIVAEVTRLESALDDAELLLEMAAEESDESAAANVGTELEALSTDLEKLERESLFFGEHDDSAAILSVHAGAGGVDAADWAEMMLRMNLRYFERRGFQAEVDEVLEAEEAGIRSATVTVRGDHAYGILESERGVHRLVRISPFDTQSRRHTSFAGVDVIPEVAETEVEIDEDDLRIDTYRSSGAGGQHVNTSDTAVRITHLPTGIAVACQAERSQLQNKNRAMALLVSRLAEHHRKLRLVEMDEIRGEQTEAGWGRQIRSYVLQPYQMVKDMRTSQETGNIQAVLDGDLSDFSDAYLHWRRSNA